MRQHQPLFRCMNMQAFDQHLNMIVGDVEETTTTVEIDDETYEEIIKVRQDLHAQHFAAWHGFMCG